MNGIRGREVDYVEEELGEFLETKVKKSLLKLEDPIIVDRLLQREK